MGPIADPDSPARLDNQALKRPHFLVNVLWSWLSVTVNIFVGLVLSPIIIRTLGEERYGVWALVFALIDYYWFFDLGFNTAITNFCARFRAGNEAEKLNVVINTALFYFALIAVILGSLAVAAARNVQALFPRVSPAHSSELSLLILIAGVSWAFFTILHVFTSALDGFQRFDLTSRSGSVAVLARSGGCVALLMSGYGLVEMSLAAVAGQLIGYLMNLLAFQRVFPQLRFSMTLVRRSMLREMASYGLHSFLATTATVLLNQGPPLLIGRLRGMAEVGFFTLPTRLLQNAVDAVSRVGLVTRSDTAERDALGKKASIFQLGVYSNRYCLALFAPLGLFLMVYGRELIKVWITPAYGANSGPLLAILAPATGLVVAGQFNSSAILFGLGTHRRYAQALMAEAVLTLTGMLWVLPQYGIVGAAWVVGVSMLFVRGLYAPWLVCRSLNAGFLQYMGGIYLRPLLAAIPIGLVLEAVKTNALAGTNWGELILAGSLTVVLFWGLAWYLVVEPAHRKIVFRSLGSRLPGFKKESNA